MTALTAKQFTNEAAAIAHLEASRWPMRQLPALRLGQRPPHGGQDPGRLFPLQRLPRQVQLAAPGPSWSVPIFRFTSGCWLSISCHRTKNGASAHELHRGLGITYKSAWFLAIASARQWDIRRPPAMGGKGGQVQAMKLLRQYLQAREALQKGPQPKSGVVALLDPATGEARAFAVEKAQRRQGSARSSSNMPAASQRS